MRDNLSITKAGDFGDAESEHLEGLVNLRGLLVAGTQDSEDGAKELDKAFSKMKIERESGPIPWFSRPVGTRGP